MSTTKRYLLGAVIMLLVLGLVTTMVNAGAYTITVTGTPDGLTEMSIGAVEACSRFDINELVDWGAKNYRIYAGMGRMEPQDDDGVYGAPTIDQIKADPNVIDWTQWDYQFYRSDTYFWSGGCPAYSQTSLYDMLVALRDNGIAPVVTLRNVNNNDDPAWAMALNPPDTPEDWNEWWEFVFGWVYWANVRNNLEVHDWQVHNEPDNAGQGWDGTLQDYIVFTQYTYDAIKYVYDTYLPGKTFRLYAPVSTHFNEWIEQSLIQNDAIVDVVDWHRYGPPADEAAGIHAWIDQYDSDGVHESLYLSEWGSWRGEYSSHGNAMNYAAQLMDHNINQSYIASSAIFAFYDWTSRMIGLVAPDGTKRPPYWSMRLMIRGLQGGKQKYAINHNIPSNVWLFPIAAVDQGTNTMYVEVLNKSNQGHSITLDVSAHATSGTVTFREYSDGVNDVEAGTGSLNNGVISFSMPSSSIYQLIIPLSGGPVPTPTPTPGSGGVMHVSDIAMSYSNAGPNYYAIATVTIVDAGNAPVEGAAVYGTFSGATSDSVSGVTGADGKVTLTSSKKKNGGTWTFCVEDVVKSGWTYDAGANVETCDSITAP